MTKNEMLLGFAMALAMNPEAMQKFAALGEEQKHSIIAGTHTVNSKEEMRQYIASLLNGKMSNHKESFLSEQLPLC